VVRRGRAMSRPRSSASCMRGHGIARWT
jgi:hypothetical protein